MIHLLLKGMPAALDRYLNSPFRRRQSLEQEIEAIQWAISLLEIHEGVKVNPNSQMWLNRLRAIVHHHKLDQHGGL